MGIHQNRHSVLRPLGREPRFMGAEVKSGVLVNGGHVWLLQAVQMMLDWLRKHQDNPYPNDDEKEMLIQKTKLTINQINYWFTNARRRILPKWALQRYLEQQEKQKEADKQKQTKQIEESSTPPLVGSTNAS